MMNQEVKVKWLEALRSGEYKQCKGQLRNTETNSFCCLGVLIEVSGINVWNHPDGPSHTACKAVYDKAELPSGPFDAEGKITTTRILADMNDSGITFEQIADHIEKNL